MPLESPESLMKNAGAGFYPAATLNLGGREIRRHDDLEHLAIVRIVEHGVPDLGRLDPAAAFLHELLAFALELVPHPALEQVDELELDVMIMALAHLVGAGRQHADDLGNDH